MKLSRIWAPLGLAVVTLLAAPFGAFAQSAPSYNYVGIGGSEDGFLVNGKLSVSDNISIRPSIATDFNFDDEEDVSYLVPLTYDFNTVGNGRAAFNPFVGAGIAGDIGEDSDVELALVTGADYRFARNYVVNGAINYTPFADKDEVGFTAGIGYLF